MSGDEKCLEMILVSTLRKLNVKLYHQKQSEFQQPEEGCFPSLPC